MRRTSGFTLIELLVVIILMILIIGVVANVFTTSKEIVSQNEARNTVYVNGGYAMDRMMNDLFGCLAYDSGSQRFVMQNMIVNGPGDAGKNYYTVVAGGAPEQAGGHYLQGSAATYKAAADVLSFRAVTTAADVPGMYQITYYLKGDAEGGARLKTQRSDRPIYTLMRRITVAQGAETVASNWTGFPQVDINPDPVATNMQPIQEEELCHYVLSFNVEYLAAPNAGGQGGMNFSQIEPSPCPWGDPLGNGAGINDLGGGPPANPGPYRVPAIRVTMVVVDDNGERSERMISHVFEIPMG